MSRKTFSYSFLNTPCGLYLKRVKIDKAYPEEKSAPMLKGQETHKFLEMAVKNGQPLPPHLEHMAPWVNRIIAGEGFVQTELRLAITHDWKPCAYFANNVYYRIVCDVVVERGEHALNIDWKDGNPNYVDPTQLDDQTAGLFINRPRLQKVTSVLAWTKRDARPTRKDYTRGDLPKLLDSISHRIVQFRKMERNNHWPAVSCFLCRNCPIMECAYNENARKQGQG